MSTSPIRPEQNALLSQPLPAITIRPADCTTPESIARIMKLSFDTLAKQTQDALKRVNDDPRMKDDRVASALRVMEGTVGLQRARLGPPGSLAYVVDGGRELVFGSSAAPAPTDPSTGPDAGAPPHPLLDGVQNNDTVAQTPTRGSIVYANATPLWDELVKGTDKQVLGYNATDILPVSLDNTYLANRTRRDWIDSTQFIQANGTGMAFTTVGTYPNMYRGMQFIDAPAAAPQGILATWRVPKDWASGTVTVKMLYRLTLAGAGVNSAFVFRLRTLAYSVGGSPVAASTDVTDIIGNLGNYVNVAEETLGAITVAADQIVRIVIDRNAADGNDDTTDTVSVLGLTLEYTADM